MFRWFAISLLTFSLPIFADTKAEEVAKDLGISVQDLEQVLVLGESEWIYIEDIDKNLKARIDTGATTSSISAIEIHSTKEKGKQRIVEFKFAHGDWESEKFTLPVVRRVRINQSSSDKSDSRYVVELPIQIGSFKTTTEFTLVDRSRLTYPVLIGRSFIEDQAIVDVAHKYIQSKVSMPSTPNTEEPVAEKATDDNGEDKNTKETTPENKTAEDENKAESVNKTSEDKDTVEENDAPEKSEKSETTEPAEKDDEMVKEMPKK